MLRNREYFALNSDQLISKLVRNRHELLNHPILELAKDVLHPNTVITLLLDETSIRLNICLEDSDVGRVLINLVCHLLHLVCRLVLDVLT